MPLARTSLQTLILALGLAATTPAFAHPPTGIPIADLTHRIADRPDDPALYLARGDLRRIDGDLAAARADYAEAERLDPRHPALPLAWAELALASRDPASARGFLDRALQARPDDARALTLRARAHVETGERRGAIADLGAAIALGDRPTPDHYLERARLQIIEEDRAGARQGLDDARARLGVVASLELFAIELDLADGRIAAAAARLAVLRPQFGNAEALAGLEARIASAGGATAVRAPPAAAVPAPAAAPAPPSATTPGAPALTRGPYLMMGSPNAVTIRWRTDAPSDSRVLFGVKPGVLTEVAYDPVTTTEHVVRLTGLMPAKRYYYSVGTTAGPIVGDSSHTFVTAPAGTATPHVRAWIIGDSGFSSAEAVAVRDAYAAWTGTRGTDLWLMLGDNAYQTGTDAEYQDAVFNQYSTMLKQVVLWPTRGNHDIFRSGPNNDYFDFFTMPTAAEAGGLASGTEAYYSFDWANIHFICLDSQGSSRLPGGAMLTWLSNDLAANTKPWVIAFWHHPPYSKGSHDSDTETQLVEMREYALPILEAGGVDVVLCGHSHSYERSFMLDGHYGLSTDLQPNMIVDGGNGRPDGDGAYVKPATPTPHAGAVHAVAGSSASIHGGPLNHPVMVSSLNVCGSLVLDVHQNQLAVRFLNLAGVVQDSFAISKTGNVGVDPTPGASLGVELGPGLPNPFTGDLRMSYTLGRAGHVRVSVIDAAGRRVATIEEGWREAGTHEARWDGRDSAGRPAPNGVYVAVLEADGVRLSRKIAQVR